jgi:hypothetical protein
MMGVQLIPLFSSRLSEGFFFFLCPSEEELGAVVSECLER